MTDKEYREYIIKKLDSNIFVVAGAGSGKTTILVDRMVALVEEKEDIISRLCAITFTKNAATNFLAKFEEKLRLRSKMTKEEWQSDKTTHLKEPTDLSRERCKKALERINECFAGTIDSFCNLVISEHPLEANVPSSSEIIDEGEFIQIYKKEFKAISDGVKPYEGLKDKLKNFERIHTNSAETFSKCIVDIMDAITLEVQFDRPRVSLEEAWNTFRNTYERNLLSDIQYIINHESDIVPYNDSLEGFRRLKNTYRNKKELSLNDVGNIKYLFSNIKDLRFQNDPEFFILPYSFMKQKKVYKMDDSIAKDSTSAYFLMMKAFYDIVYSYSMDFLVSAAFAIKMKLKREGKLTFTDYLLCFREMLLNDMDHNMSLIKHIRNRHSIFLLDESQDTSPIQTEVFMLLTSSVKAKTKHECKPIPGSLFIVGDPKQSIYRFRGADIVAYQDTMSMFSEEDSNNSLAILSNNFRSTDLLCNYFNQTFMDMPFFYPIPSKDRYESKEGNITTGIYDYKDYIHVIKALVDENSRYRKVSKGKESKIEYKDIMLITKSMSNHGAIMEALKEAGIPVFVEGEFYISSNEAIEALYAIYAYISKDSIEYRLNLLACPIFKLFDENLKGNVSSSILTKIEELKENKYMYNPISLYQEIIERLELFLYVTKENIEYVYFLGEKLKEAYNNGLITDYNSAEEFLAEFIKKKLDRCPTLFSEPNQVHLANLHKVKGLEAPVVILIEARNSSKKASCHQDYLEGKSYVICCGENKKNNGTTYVFETKSFLEYGQREEALLNEELLRLKYVAATRAKDFLFLPEKKGYWADLGEGEAFLDENNYNEEESTIISPTLNTVSLDFNDKESYVLKRPSDDHINIEIPEEDRVPINPNHISSKDKGTLIHKMMELYVRSNFKYNKQDLIKESLSSIGLGSKELYQMLEDIYEVITHGGYKQYLDKYPSDILSILKSADELHPEYPFSYRDGNDIIYGLIDLLYVKDNKVYIIDYKTNYEGENHQGEIDWENIYAGQLASYKEAIEKLYKMPVEAHIYHIG